MNTHQSPAIRALVIGASSGGLCVLLTMLKQLPTHISFPIFIVTHQKESGTHFLAHILDNSCSLPVHEVEDKMEIKSGHIYVAPSGYHMLLESDHYLALCIDDLVNFCRPSIDVLFESAADVFGSETMGIILTGMGHDGADGLLEINHAGGICAVQNPNQAEFSSMPESALKKVPHALQFSPDSFAIWLAKFTT